MIRPVLLVLSLALPAQADARPRKSKASAAERIGQSYILLGKELFEVQNYAEATKNFLAAERTFGDAGEAIPSAVYRELARCYDQSGQIVAALSYYKKYLALKPSKGARGARERKQAEEASGRLQTMLDGTMISFEVEPPGTEITVDRRKLGTSPVDPVNVNPGPHQVLLWSEGYEPRNLDVDVAPGAVVPIVVSLSRPRVVDTDTPASVWWSLGAGVALFGGGVAFGVSSQQKVSDLEGLEYEGDFEVRTSEAELIDTHDSAKQRALVANVLFGAGAAAVATGVILWLTAQDPSTRPPDESAATWRRAVPTVAASERSIHLSWELLP